MQELATFELRGIGQAAEALGLGAVAHPTKRTTHGRFREGTFSTASTLEITGRLPVGASPLANGPVHRWVGHQNGASSDHC